MEENLQTRRRAPAWVRAFSDVALHGLVGKLHRNELYGPDNTSGQAWLMEVSINELEYRARRDRRAGIRCCSCQFCCGPFELFPIEDDD